MKILIALLAFTYQEDVVKKYESIDNVVDIGINRIIDCCRIIL